MSKTTAIKVTDVNFRKFVKGNICGYATIEFNKVLKVNGFKIMHGKDGFFVTMPAHIADDQWYSDVFISDEDIYNQFQVDVINAVLDEYDEDDLIDKKSKKSANSKKSKKSTKSKKSYEDEDNEDDEDDEDDGLPF